MSKKKKKKSKVFLWILAVAAAACLIWAGIQAVRTQIVYKELTADVTAGRTEYPSVDFVQPGMLADYTDADYDRYFEGLRAAGYDSVILQFTRYKVGGVCYTYYPSACMTDYYDTVDDSMSNVLGDLLAAAKKHGFKVWVGLSVDDDDWWGVTCYFDEGWMSALGEVDVQMIREIAALYSEEEAFYGWYWAHELFSNPAGIEKIWAKLLNSAIDTLNEVDPARPLMLSPFRHVQTGLVTNEYRMWHRFFEAVGFREGDIFAPQDSMGKLNQNKEISKRSYRLIYDYLNAVKRAVGEEEGLTLWINVELFQKENGDEYNTADIERVKMQLANASRVTDTLVTFSMSHYGLPEGTNDTAENRADFYNTYLEYRK